MRTTSIKECPVMTARDVNSLWPLRSSVLGHKVFKAVVMFCICFYAYFDSDSNIQHHPSYIAAGLMLQFSEYLWKSMKYALIWMCNKKVVLVEQRPPHMLLNFSPSHPHALRILLFFRLQRFSGFFSLFLHLIMQAAWCYLTEHVICSPQLQSSFAIATSVAV